LWKHVRAESCNTEAFISVLNFRNAHHARKHRMQVQRVKPVRMRIRSAGGFELRALFLSCLEFTSYVANGTFILCLGMQPSKTFSLIHELCWHRDKLAFCKFPIQFHPKTKRLTICIIKFHLVLQQFQRSCPTINYF